MKIDEGHIPLYFQFYMRIKNDILLGEIPLGAKIPSLQELTEIYGVSLITARKTMDLLEQQGMITRKRGHGTFVRDDIEKPTRGLRPLKDEIKSLNFHEELEFHLISKGWIDPPVRIQNIFLAREDSLNDGRIFHIRRTMAPKSRPNRIRLQSTYIPAWVIKQLDPEKFTTKPVIQVICESNIWNKIAVVETIRPWISNTEESDFLGINEGSAVFWISYEFLDKKDDVLFYTESLTSINTHIRKAVVSIDKKTGIIS